MHNLFETLYDYYNWIKDEGIFIPEDESPSKLNKPGYYIEPLDFFISEEKLYLRLNHVDNLERNYRLEIIQPHHRSWVKHMADFIQNEYSRFEEKLLVLT